MTHNIQRYFAVLAVALMVMIPALVAGRDSTPDNSDKKKAAYIFLEAQNEKSRGRSDAYFDLLKRAYELDSTNTTIAFYMGHAMMMIRSSDMGHYDRALALMKKHFDAHPQDFYETTFYSDANMAMGNNEEALLAIKTLCDANPGKIEIQQRLVEAYTRTGKHLEACALLDTIELHHGSSFELTSKKISNLISLNDTVKAINEMRKLLATAPKNVNYNLGMAGVMQHFNMNDSALHYIDAAQQYEPSNGYTYLAKAEYFQETGDSAAYENQIYQALTSENLEVEDKLGLLLTYIRGTDIQMDSTGRVDNLFNVLIEQHPHQADIHYLYGEYLIARKQYRPAAEQQSYVMDINPTDASGWKRLMIINMMAEDFPKALEAAEKALVYNPDSLDLYVYIAPTYYQMKQYDKALETYQIALQMTDSLDTEHQSDIYSGMGDVYYEMGDTIKAFNYYDKSLEINPLNYGAMNNYAYFLSLAETQLDKAEQLSARTVAAYPDNPIYLDTYAWIYFKKKDYTKALLYIKKAIDFSTKPSADELEHYGDILFMNGEHEQAVEQWEKALKLSEEDKDNDNSLLRRKVEHKTIFFK